MAAKATIVILPFLTNDPSALTSSRLGVWNAQIISRAVMLISQKERHASAFRRSALSAASASIRISGCPASAAPVNVPAIPGANADMRQNKPVRAYAGKAAFLNCWNVYFSLMILSRA